jgi:hypothetical protein
MVGDQRYLVVWAADRRGLRVYLQACEGHLMRFYTICMLWFGVFFRLF